MTDVAGAMELTLSVPTQTVFSGPARRVVARGPHGMFGVLPRHTDCACPLEPGILIVEETEGRERFFGVDEGLLVKAGPKVRIFAYRVFRADSLDHVRDAVEGAFAQIEDRERAARTALSRIEADVARRFAEMSRPPP